LLIFFCEVYLDVGCGGGGFEPPISDFSNQKYRRYRSIR